MHAGVATSYSMAVRRRLPHRLVQVPQRYADLSPAAGSPARRMRNRRAGLGGGPTTLMRSRAAAVRPLVGHERSLRPLPTSRPEDRFRSFGSLPRPCGRVSSSACAADVADSADGRLVQVEVVDGGAGALIYVGPQPDIDLQGLNRAGVPERDLDGLDALPAPDQRAGLEVPQLMKPHPRKARFGGGVALIRLWNVRATPAGPSPSVPADPAGHLLAASGAGARESRRRRHRTAAPSARCCGSSPSRSRRRLEVLHRPDRPRRRHVAADARGAAGAGRGGGIPVVEVDLLSPAHGFYLRRGWRHARTADAAVGPPHGRRCGDGGSGRLTCACEASQTPGRKLGLAWK